MHKEESEAKCADKIPADDVGRKAAESVKLLKAKANVTSPDHPCSESQARIVFLHKADEMGDYWRTQLAPHISRLPLRMPYGGTNSLPPWTLIPPQVHRFRCCSQGRVRRTTSWEIVMSLSAMPAHG